MIFERRSAVKCTNVMSHMKEIKMFSLFVLLALLFVAAGPVSAFPHNLDGNYTFKDLGLDSDIILRGPYDAETFRFDLSPTFALREGYLDLIITTFDTSASGGGETSSESVADSVDGFSGVVLDVYFDDKLQQSVPLIKGEKITYTIEIDSADINSVVSTLPRKISFFLDAAIDCDIDQHNSVVIIDALSEVYFSYDEIPAELDLHQLPRPIYLERLNSSDKSYVVLPASPSSLEAQAGITVMATFGRITFGNLPLSLITEDQVTPDLLAASNLIFVGKTDSFLSVQDVFSPSQISNMQLLPPEFEEGDGGLKYLTSPWNPLKYILLVYGKSDEGVLKAAQALSTGNIQTGLSTDYSIVENVNSPLVSNVISDGALQVPSTDFTFADLGQDFLTVEDIGENYIEYEFVIPNGLIPTGSPYLQLQYSRSAFADASRSGIVVYLNEIKVGSVKFSTEETGHSIETIELPISAFRPGKNLLEIVFNLVPVDECSTINFSGSSIWATVFPESLIHLPLVSGENTSSELGNISLFPYPFANDPSFSSTAFVLSVNDPGSVSEAGRVAYEMGRLVPGSILLPKVFFDTALPEDYRESNLIVIGEPAKLTFLEELKDSLPAYFEAGSNVAVLETQQVIYRISDGKALGYLELLASPWSPDLAILGIFGTNREGLAASVSAITGNGSRETFVGNFVTIDGDDSIIVDTRTGLGTGRVAPEIGADNVSQEEKQTDVKDFQADLDKQRQIILFALIGIVAVMVVVIILALRTRKKEK